MVKKHFASDRALCYALQLGVVLLFFGHPALPREECLEIFERGAVLMEPVLPDHAIPAGRPLAPLVGSGPPSNWPSRLAIPVWASCAGSPAFSSSSIVSTTNSAGSRIWSNVRSKRSTASLAAC